MSDLGSALRTRLGTTAAHEMTVALDEAKVDTLRAAQEQFDARLDARFAQARSEFRGDLATVDANLRVAMSEGFSTIRSAMSEMRVDDIVRWSFFFWVGQLVALGSLMAFLIRGAMH